MRTIDHEPADAGRLAPLRITFVLLPFLAGLDKFVGVLADWESYLAPGLREALPVDPHSFMAIVGVVEMTVGILIATRWVKCASYVAAAWLALIASQLVAGSHLDIAVRDLALAVAAWTLARYSAAPAAVAARARPAGGTA